MTNDWIERDLAFAIEAARTAGQDQRCTIIVKAPRKYWAKHYLGIE